MSGKVEVPRGFKEASAVLPRNSGSGESRQAAQATLPTRARPVDPERGAVERRPAAAAPAPQTPHHPVRTRQLVEDGGILWSGVLWSTGKRS